MYDNMSEQGGGGGPPSRGLTLSLPPPSAPYVRPFTRSTRAQPSNEMGIYAPSLSLSGPPLPSTLYSALRPFGSHSLPHSLPHSLTHHPELTLLLHHAGHGDGGAGVGAHHRVVRSEEVHVAAGTAFQSGGAAQKHRRRPGSNHGVRNGAAIRP